MNTHHDRSGRFWPLLLLSCALVVISPETILAHGGPPAALGLIAAGDEGPTVILLNEGLALKRPEAWSYMCPSLWGEVNQSSGKYPMSRSADGVDSWVIGESDLYLLRDQMLVAQNRPELQRNKVIALANDAQNVYALHYTGNGTDSMSTEVLKLQENAEPALWMSPDYWSAITADSDGVHLARLAGEKLIEVVTIDKDGAERNRAMAMLDVTPPEIQLHTAAGRLYVTANDGNNWLFGYFEGKTWKQVTKQTVAILGPQASADGTLWLSIQGVLQKVEGDTLVPVDEPRMITCLEQWNDWRYACVGGDIFRLSESGLGEQVFAMNGFHAPDPKLVPPDMQANCQQQWVLYTVDAVRSGFTFVEWPGTGAAGATGSAGSTGSAGTGGSGAMPGAASNGAAGAGASGAVAGSAALAAADPSESSGGCSALGGRAREHRFALFLAIAAIALALRAQRRRRAA